MAIATTNIANKPPAATAAIQAEFKGINASAMSISVNGKATAVEGANFRGTPKPIIARREPDKSASFVIPATLNTADNNSLAHSNTIAISTSMQNGPV